MHWCIRTWCTLYVYCVYLRTYVHIRTHIMRFCMQYMCLLSSSNANIQLLLAYGSPLLMKNTLGKTPCDLASGSGQFVIVKLLEPKMVFVVSECAECCV